MAECRPAAATLPNSFAPTSPAKEASQNRNKPPAVKSNVDKLRQLFPGTSFSHSFFVQNPRLLPPSPDLAAEWSVGSFRGSQRPKSPIPLPTTTRRVIAALSIMFSGSNSYLGGNSLRPGPQQYGGSFNMGQGQQPQQPGQQPGQPSPFAAQPTGFGQAPLQQQYTGFPQQTGVPSPQAAGQLQAQYTGFPGQGPPSHNFQSGAPPLPGIPQQYQQQFQPQQQSSPFSSSAPTQPASLAPAPAPMKPQATGFSEMAASFQTGPSSQSKPRAKRVEKTSNKIPNIRLSFITAQDQAKFETLFKSAVGDGQTTMSGEKARDLLLRSRLDGDSLSQIWYVPARHHVPPASLTYCSSQDSRGHDAVRPAALSRVRPGDVPLQPQTHGEVAAVGAAQQHQE